HRLPTAVCPPSARCALPSANSFRVLDSMPAELIAQRRVHLRGIALVLPRREPLHEGQGDDWSGHRLIDRIEDSPASLARVRDPALAVREVVALLLEGALQQLTEPRAAHRALVPDVRGRVPGQVVLRGRPDLAARCSRPTV